LAWPTSVQSVPMNAAATGRDRGNTAQVGERSLRGDPVGIVAGAGQQLSSDLGPDTQKAQQVGCDLSNELGDLMIGFADFLAQLLMPAGKSPQRRLGGLLGVAQVVSGTQAGADGDDLRRPQMPQLLAQLGWAGHDQSLDLIVV